MKRRYISDLHLFHDRVIDFDNRPFNTIKEMHEHIVREWNLVTKKDDVVYIIGDTSMGKKPETIEILKQLNGTKVLVPGNHDRWTGGTKVKGVVSIAPPIHEINDYAFNKKYKVIMCHYPLLFHRGVGKDNFIHLYGHVHNSHEYELLQHLQPSFKGLALKGRDLSYLADSPRYNTGCMLPEIDYKPRTLEEIIRANGGIEKELSS